MNYEDFERQRQDLEYTPMDRDEFMHQTASLKAEFFGGEQGEYSDKDREWLDRDFARWVHTQEDAKDAAEFGDY